MSQAASAYFVEQLTARAWLSQVRPRLERDGAFRAVGPVRLWYVAASTAGRRLAARASEGTAVRVERFDFDAAAMHDDDGKLIWLRIYYEDMARALQAICARPPLEGVLAASGSERFALHLRKQILPGAPVTQPYGLWRALYLLNACVWRARRDGIQAPAAIFMTARAWMGSFIEYARSATGVEVIVSGRQPVVLLLLARLLRHDVRAWIGRLRRALRGDLSAFAAAPREDAPPCVALQYYGQFNLERPDLHSDFFFWQCSRFPGRNLLALFSLPQDPLDADRARQLEAKGIRALALGYGATTLRGDRVDAPATLLRNGASATALLLARAVVPQESWWLRAERSAFESRRAYWRSLFANRNVRVFATWFKYDAEHCAIAEALADLGGALAVYQRSFEGNALPQGALATDLYFSFSGTAAAVEAAAGSTIRYGVVTGYLGDHRFAPARAGAAAVRENLQARGARHIAAYFDENSGDDSRWILGHERERRHYAFFLERVLAEPTLGLVLKPKSPRTLRARLGPVADLLNRALATGRCHLYGEGVLQGAVPPVQAALSADLVIHSSVAAATAGVEATLAGARVALLDDDGWSISPLNALGRGRVIFDRAELLWGTWAAHRGGGADGFADWSGMLDALDPFRDGRAAERMGTYLHWLIEGFEAGRAKTQVLAEAAERYARTWGADKVFSVKAVA